MIKGFEDFAATRMRVVDFVKERSPEHLRDRRIAKALCMPVKVVRACLHFHSSVVDPRVQKHYRSPHNMRRKRPVWFYGDLPTNLVVNGHKDTQNPIEMESDIAT